MSFFEDFPVPTPPQRSRSPRFVPPPWTGAPRDELPGIVHIGKFLHVSPTRVIAVKSAEVYSTGCSFDLTWVVRRAEESDEDWDALNGVFFQHGLRPRPGQDLMGALLLFGVELPDGSKAIAGTPGPSGYFDPSAQPEAPVLTLSGGGGSGGDEELTGTGSLWLWPLPEPGDIRLVAQWPHLGIQEKSVVLDGGQLRAAAADVQRFWS
ncbi:hypothetical protein ACIPY3_10900 [Paenarthrobacter sp. NPDC089714]|uniref:hypothetical protein n=1 Tax=Paenarthrobacter sp. NPDC089714 TaxID=3364377 RepID=UPI0037FC4418